MFMKQKLMITGILFLLGITSCKKNAPEETAAPQELTGKKYNRKNKYVQTGISRKR